MISGSGLLATTFKEFGTRRDVYVHAAGVSNSQCCDIREFARERDALLRSIDHGRDCDRFLYFSTCSIGDPSAQESPYVAHKAAMERLVQGHPSHLILRLPQLAARTPNPHTLLNFLHARIARGERFAVWRNARRNIIDCDDARALGVAALDAGLRGATINIANSVAYEMIDIVATMERVVCGHAVYDLIDRGAPYPIDIAPIGALLARTGVSFDAGYLERVLRKYYGP